MAVPTYVTDLAAQTLDTADTNTWVEPPAWAAGTIVSPETDFFIQGTGCAAKYMASGGVGLGALVRDNGAGVTVPTPGGFFIWIYPQGVNQLNNFANGGIRLIVGSSTANFYAWRVAGDDTIPYGGWTCWVVDPSAPTPVVDDGTGLDADYQVGTPTATKQVFGAGVNQQVNAKGGTGFDAMRYGRGEMKIEGGNDIGDGYATFAGVATYNDNTSNRWGLFQAIAGGYLYKGLFLMGSATNAVDFRDSNVSILVENTARVTSDFNTIEVRNASSRVDWTAVTVQALGTVAPGNFIVTNNATVNLTNCSFTDMGTFGFLGNSTLLNTTFKRCQLVTQASAVITNCRFDSATGAVALLSNNPAAITGSTFVSDGTGHAIEITTAGEYALSNCTFTGYAATGTPGTSGNEVIYNNSSGNVIINASGCVGTITYKNGTSATTTVNQTITLTLTGLVTGSDIVILDAGTTTERVNVDSNAGTTYAYGYTDSGSSIDVGVFKMGYVPFYIRAYTLAATAASLPCAQVLDRNYLV